MYANDSFYRVCNHYQAEQYILSNIPEEKQDQFNDSGIYALYYKQDIMYIGKSKNMLQRICQHLTQVIFPWAKEYKNDKYRVIRDLFLQYAKDMHWEVLEYSFYDQLDENERKQILKYNPPLNTMRVNPETMKFYRDKIDTARLPL